jgi:transcriptional regulator with XRE-family HTH domain
MDLGKAIKTIRKRKGIKQKELANLCGISANAMVSIEANKSFPHKITIRKICEVLDIPVAYLLFFCITDEDIPENSKHLFNLLYEPIRGLLLKE